MPKIKTHKGAKARFDITGTGKLMRMKGGKSHLRTHKSKRVKHMYDSKIPVAAVDRVRISRLIPNGV
jgi:large subunit ribosomal protein L35